MKKYSLAIGLGVLLVAGVAVTLFFFGERFRKGDMETALTPEAQTERLTTFFLQRKIERLRDRAVYTQHREEGRKLLELSGIHIISPPSTFSSSGSATSSSTL